MIDWTSPLRDALVTGLTTVIAALATWAATWVRSKVRQNEVANEAILKQVESNAGNVAALATLLNGRLQQLLQRTSELGHAQGMLAGRESAGPFVDEARLRAEEMLIKASAEAKRILAEAATAAKEQIELERIEAVRSALGAGRHDDPPTAQSPPPVLTPDPDSPET